MSSDKSDFETIVAGYIADLEQNQKLKAKAQLTLLWTAHSKYISMPKVSNSNLPLKDSEHDSSEVFSSEGSPKRSNSMKKKESETQKYWNDSRLLQFAQDWENDIHQCIVNYGNFILIINIHFANLFKKL